jgi:hypothetical protein
LFVKLGRPGVPFTLTARICCIGAKDSSYEMRSPGASH